MESGRDTAPNRGMPGPKPCGLTEAVSSSPRRERANTKKQLVNNTRSTSSKKVHTTSCLSSTVSINLNQIQTHRPSSLFHSLFQTWVGNIGVVQSCFLTTVGLGWAIYTRAVRFSIQPWKGGFNTLQSSQSKQLLSDLHPPAIEPPRSTGVRLQLEAVPRHDGVDRHGNDSLEDSAGSKSQQDAEAHLPDPISTTKELLQKHFDYLMPWVSNQSYDDSTAEKTSADSEIVGEIQRMSLQSFTDLSTAIYRDVRRREQESSPDTAYPPKPWDQCMRSRQNGSMMVLCRTINEQFYQLVLALVLEQARRLAKMRIKLNRRAAALKR